MLGYKNIKTFLQKVTLQISLSKILWLKKSKNTVPWTYVINDLNVEEIVGIFYEKELRKTNQKEFRLEKVIKKNSDQLYVKWKGYNYSFNRWIAKIDRINKWIFSETKIFRRKCESWIRFV